jgi:hypothetical protein
MKQYERLLEDEVFKAGEKSGSLRTALTMLTDMLIELNALEIYYQKPASKSVVPPQIAELRKKVEGVKSLVQSSLKQD